MSTHPGDEAEEEAIEDLEAPAEALNGVAGGAGEPGCQAQTAVVCPSPNSCDATRTDCLGATEKIVIWER